MKVDRKRHGVGPAPGCWRVQRTALAVAALVLAAALLVFGARAAWALNHAGSIAVTATMGQMSPNAIRVGDMATASLDASYGQPGNAPEEANYTAQYSWSVLVEYKPLYADTYGAPPSDSYTLSISPSQPSATSGATVSFTPLIAGYWQFTGTCGVTLTDLAGNDYWTGSGTSSPVQATSMQVDLVVSVDGTQLTEAQETDPGVQLPQLPQYQGYAPPPLPVFTATQVAPADSKATLNWTNSPDVVVESTAGAVLSPGQVIPVTKGPFSFYAYTAPSPGAGVGAGPTRCGLGARWRGWRSSARFAASRFAGSRFQRWFTAQRAIAIIL